MDMPCEPRPRDDLRKTLQAAGFYGTLAVLFGNWNPNTLEAKALGRATPNRRNSAAEKTHSFKHYLAGGLPRATTLKRILEVYEGEYGPAMTESAKEQINHWSVNPLGAILCIPGGHDYVTAHLEMLPQGPARAFVWDEGSSSHFGEPLRKRTSTRKESIDALVQMADYSALLAIVGKMRLMQLEGTFEQWDARFERAIWKILPRVIATTPQLLVSEDHAICAMEHFLRWEPFSGCRFIRNLQEGYPAPEWMYVKADIRQEVGAARARGLNLPDDDIRVGCIQAHQKRGSASAGACE